MSSLYELTQNALELQEMFESGEIDEQTLADTLDSMDIEDKVQNVCKMIRNLDAKATAYKEEKDRFAQKQKVCENGIKRLKENLLYHLNMLDKKKVDTGLFTVSKSVSKSVSITDVNAIDEFFLEPQPPKIKTQEIGKALRGGIKVAGAELTENEYVTIR